MNEKIIFKRKFILEGLLALLIAISPIIFYSYKYISFDTDNSWSFLGINFTDNGYGEISMAFYFYLSKVIPLMLLILWFITCKQWWYHVILIPIAMYAFQLYSVFSDDVDKIDENELLYLLAVCMIVIPLVYFIRVKLVDKYVHGIDLEAMDAEIKVINNKQGTNKKQPKPVSQKTVLTPKEVDFKKESVIEDIDIPKEIGYKSLSEKINEKLSTGNLEFLFKQFQNQLGNWLHLRF